MENNLQGRLSRPVLIMRNRNRFQLPHDQYPGGDRRCPTEPEESITRKRRNAAIYSNKLKPISGLRLQAEPQNTESVYWYYSLVIDDLFGVSRDEVLQQLSIRGVDARNFFVPIHLQPIYPELRNEYCPVSEFLGERGLSLPSGINLTEEDITYIVNCIAEIQSG